ncbi:DUF6414 family protein [Psychrobacter alimentarius]|uniref:DUF6414 family protein n=1 Tax=Psychrobacter alimentarius TaxID=261164 RepID=UPI003FD6818A
MAKQQTTKSIYDFIYLDVDRIHSYYAQLMDGLPNQKTSSSSKNKKFINKATAGPRDILHYEGQKEDVKEESLEQLMDMHHVLPRDMINLLDEYQLIEKKLAASNLGKLVMIKGLINFSDFETLGKNSDSVLELLGDKSDKERLEIKTVLNVIDAYPIGVQATMQVKSNVTHHAWMALDKKYLTSAHLVAALKHKSLSSEEFVVLGILDAIPDKFVEDDSEKDLNKFRKNLLDKRPFFEAIFSMNGVYQEVIGRPDDSYGITPISIFRVMKAKIES